MDNRTTKAATIELKALVAEASQALAALDAPRLEELVHSCEALNRELAQENNREQRKQLARQAREAGSDMAVFGRVLEATRANLQVMNRLREMRLGRLEYKAQGGAADWAGPLPGSGDGNH